MGAQPASAPVQPVVPAAPAVAAPVAESTAVIPAPSNPAPAAEPEPNYGTPQQGEAVKSETQDLPPGFESREQYDAFLKYQADQAKAAEQAPTAGLPVPPPTPF
jgi:hypothetical protein